jgi:hypothetical protein
VKKRLKICGLSGPFTVDSSLARGNFAAHIWLQEGCFSQRNINSMSERARSRKSFLHAAFDRLLAALASYHCLTLRRGRSSPKIQKKPVHLAKPLGQIPFKLSRYIFLNPDIA